MLRRWAAGVLPFFVLLPAACTDARSLEVSSSSSPPPTTALTTSTTSTTAPTTTTGPPPATEAEAEPTTTTPAVEEVAPPVAGSIEEIIDAEFGPIAHQARRVAWCESTNQPGAVNGRSRGLFQIHDVHADQWFAVIGRSYWSSWDDPVANAHFARWLHDHSGGWGPWSCKP